MIKKIIFTVLLLVSLACFSQQKNINNYKYVIVPVKFDFLNKADQYHVNSLTKFIFKKLDFETYLSNEVLPQDLLQNRCLALTAEVKDVSSFLTIKNIIIIKDCFNNTLFTSKEGFSKLKDYKRAYYQSIKKASRSLKSLNYNYTPLKEEQQVSTLTNYQKEPSTNAKVKSLKTKNFDKVINTPVLYAQKTENGFQLVNTKPEIVLNIIKSSKKDNYFIKDKNGVLYKKGDIWIAEFYENNKLIQKEYQIKF